eukprot:scaffold2497_cov62-Phaeocystis_antarctica.AAC.1
MMSHTGGGGGAGGDGGVGGDGGGEGGEGGVGGEGGSEGGENGGDGGAAPQLTATCATAASPVQPSPRVYSKANDGEKTSTLTACHAVGEAELAHVGTVHVVVEGHGADALANGGANGSVVGEREEFALKSIARLGVEVGSRPTDTGRGAGVTGWRPAIFLCEGIRWVAATIRPAGARGAAELKACGWLRRLW